MKCTSAKTAASSKVSRPAFERKTVPSPCNLLEIWSLEKAVGAHAGPPYVTLNLSTTFHQALWGTQKDGIPVNTCTAGPRMIVASGDKSQSPESCQKSALHLEGSFRMWAEIQKVLVILLNTDLSFKSFCVKARPMSLWFFHALDLKWSLKCESGWGWGSLREALVTPGRSRRGGCGGHGGRTPDTVSLEFL